MLSILGQEFPLGSKMVTRIYSSIYIRTALIPVAYLEIMAQKIPGPYGTFGPYIRSLQLAKPTRGAERLPHPPHTVP